ncbi:MAG: TIGR01841 family phasin [Pseudomonadota bacterium]
MSDKPFFPFDAEKLTEMFRTGEFAKMLGDMKMPNVDATALMATQRKNMEALVEANRAAAAGYQELFRKQVKMFEETMEGAQAHMRDFDTSNMTSEAAQARAEVMQKALEKALAHMTELAETARKSNTEAFEIVSARLRESMEELKDLSGKTGR